MPRLTCFETLKDLIQLCAVLSSRFTDTRREDGSSFVSLSGPEDEIREAARTAIRAAHEDELPNDWRYEVCGLAADAMAEASEDDELLEIASGVAESASSVYNAEILRWYAEAPDRLEYAERAREELGASEDVMGDLHHGQWLAASDAALFFLQSLETALEESK